MVLKQSLKTHLYATIYTWVTLILMLVFWIYRNYDNSVLLICGFFYGFFTIPALLFHISYTRKNWATIVVINENNFYVIIKGDSRQYYKSDIKKVTLHQPASLNHGGIPFTAMEYYSYLRLTTKEDENIIITCLMSTNFKKVIKEFSHVPFIKVPGLPIIRKVYE
jgi:hypothetical protein